MINFITKMTFLSIGLIALTTTVCMAGGDPCDDSLPTVCNADVDASGAVNVADVLVVIGNWGETGDGTYRPAGDCAPLPNGDCTVGVADVLMVISQWGADCVAYGACCLNTGSCIEGSTAAACTALGGTYFGDDSTCADGSCNAKSDGDECESAIAAVEGANPFDTTGLTGSGNEPDGTLCVGAFPWTWDSSPDVWFEFTAAEDDNYMIDTCGSGFDTMMVIYEDSCTNEIGCNDDGDCGLQSEYELSATAGSTYYVRIGGFAAATGTGALNVNVVLPPQPGACCYASACLPLDSVECGDLGGVFAGDGTDCKTTDCDDLSGGDTCADAIVVSAGSTSFDNSFNTDSGIAYDDAQCVGTYLGEMHNDQWFIFTPLTDGLASFSTCDGSGFDTDMVLYEGDCDNLVQVACNGDGTGGTGCQAYYSTIDDHPVTAGMAVYIRIGGWDGAAAGSGTLTIEAAEDVPSACCVGSTCQLLELGPCAAAGGFYFGAGSVCDDVACYQGCPAGSAYEDDICREDGDTSADPNGGPFGSGTQPIASGVTLCGTNSVFDNVTDGIVRDFDLFTLAGLENGGVHTIAVGNSGYAMTFGILQVDPADGLLYGIELWVLTPGAEGVVETSDLPAAEGYLVGVFPDSWDESWTCDSGLTDYFIQVD